MFRAARAKTAGTTALISEEQANFSSRRGCALKQNTFARPVSEASFMPTVVTDPRLALKLSSDSGGEIRKAKGGLVALRFTGCR
jgi:hypothetical protein